MANQSKRKMDLNTLRIPVRSTTQTSYLHLSEEQDFISLQEHMAGNIFSSPFSSPEAMPPGHAIRMAEMNTEKAGESMESTTSSPSCGQSLDEDENEPPVTLNIQSLEDFMRENPRSASNSASANGQSLPSSEHISRFHMLCQQRNIPPKITETEVGPQRFTATANFGERKVSTNDHFPSKRAAREAVCKLAIDLLQQQPWDQTLPGSKRKASTPDVQSPEPEKSENWIGMLQEYAQRERISLPVYNELMTSTFPMRFTSTVSICDIGISSSSITEGPHSSKQAAKAAAAKAAIQILRAQGFIPATGAVPKRRKSSVASQTHGGGTGLTQVMRDFHVSSPGTSTPSLPQQIHELSSSLGLQSPMWDVQCSMPTTGEDGPRLPLWDVAAHFSERDVRAHPRLAGPVGQVWRVCGKERAKLESCVRVLGVLEDVGREREK